MKTDIEQKLSALCNELFKADIDPELTRPDEQFGDYATNVALRLGKQLNKNPRDIAEQLVQAAIEPLKGTVRELSIAGPGFINLTLDEKVLYEAAAQAAGSQPADFAKQVVVIETNNPNPFKDLHIGHAYNSIVADTIANLLEAGQGDVHRVSYHGDVGLHVGKSMWAILRHLNGDAGKLKDIPEDERPAFLSSMYAEGAAAYEQDDLAKQQIEDYAKESFTLEDSVFKDVYETCKGWSFAYFDDVFTRIGSKPIERRYVERETDEAGRKAVEEHIGPIFERSDGAIIFPAERHGLHTRVFISSRGTTLYEARDLGLMQLKQTDFQPAASYIVTANEQKEYFKVVLKAADLALPELAGVTRNISTGMVKLSTGKMSSRTGTAVNIGWLFDEITKALKLRSNNDETIPDGVIGALRYAMLKVRIGGDVVFDVNEAISLEGNSGPYLQYAHARARSILSKSSTQLDSPESLEGDERSLLRKISEFTEVKEHAVTELLPHHICTYLYELAQDFNRFYEHNRVINDAREAVRVSIIGTYADVLKDGLTLLGIPAPDRM